MLLIYCPHCCEEREEEEFTYADEAFIERPQNPDEVSDDQWRDYLFNRDNIRGEQDEQWAHTAGCRKFFVVRRDTATNTIKNVMTLKQALDTRKKK